MDIPLPLPKSRDEIARIQRLRKRHAFALAKTARWYRGKLDHIDADKLEDKDAWERIPILDKDTLRTLSHAEILDTFSVVPDGRHRRVLALRRLTGQPVFYPRTGATCATPNCPGGARFPASALGRAICATSPFRLASIRPARSSARSARLFNVGMVWVGAGQFVSIDRATRPDPEPAAHGVHRDEQFRASILRIWPRQRGSIWHHPRCASLSARRIAVGGQRGSSRGMWGAEVLNVFGMSEAGPWARKRRRMTASTSGPTCSYRGGRSG